ncbi:MAG: hypothetical protein AAGH89_04685 [Verrucomicrobiota bacterium]
MSYLKNAEIRVGVDLNRGGSIVYLSRDDGANLINNYDLGRQVQLSFFSGPVPFSTADQQAAEHWRHIGWNPIQAGDDFGNASEILEHRNDGKSIYVKTRPLQWPLEKVPGECTFESWLELDGLAVKVRARLNNARSDHTTYPARLQELPAVYANAPYSRVVSYTQGRPFIGDAVTEIPKSESKHPWTFWQGTEGWSALLDEKNNGLGLLTPGRVHFTGGFAGRPGTGGTHANSTGYLAGQGREILDHNITYEFRYELVAGSLEEIRARASSQASDALPEWVFQGSRLGWHHVNAVDRGWPIGEWLEVGLDQEDPRLVGPYTFWHAEKAPIVEIECALKTSANSALLFWQRHGAPAPTSQNHVRFPIKADGEFHRYEVNLADAETYHGPMIRLRFDPVDFGAPGDFVKIKAIRLKTGRAQAKGSQQSEKP